jgi:uncharacterized protein YukE
MGFAGARCRNLPGRIESRRARVVCGPDGGLDASKQVKGGFMPQAVVDPEELRRFAQNLKKFSGDIQDRITMLGTQLVDLGKTWRDQEHKKFSDEFEQHMRTIARFLELTDRHVPYLMRKAEIIEEYLQQR